MRQQVNLYGSEFRRQDQPVSARQIVWYAGGLLVVLLLVEAMVAWRWSVAKSELATLQEEEQVVEQRLEQLKASRPVSERARLEARIEQLQARVQRRRELLAIISGQEFGNSEGFSEYLTAMARQTSGETALTHFRLLQGGEYLELEGWTRRPAAVPEYLHQLREENIFQNVKFGVLDIENEPRYTHKLRFSVVRKEESS